MLACAPQAGRRAGRQAPADKPTLRCKCPPWPLPAWRGARPCTRLSAWWRSVKAARLATALQRGVGQQQVVFYIQQQAVAPGRRDH